MDGVHQIAAGDAGLISLPPVSPIDVVDSSLTFAAGTHAVLPTP